MALGIVYPFYEEVIKRREHILIAGMTGSGKSVFINGMINSILYKDPSKNRLVLIDPKRVELSPYKDMPHTEELATDIPQIESLLNRCLIAIENRFREMEIQGLRMYRGPKIYIFIDEMADLMLTSPRSKKLIQRIAQIGRAANVQLICATQCPIVDVIPTQIKVNFGMIVGLHTRSPQDSRNIIGRSGCEILPKYGRALIQYADEVDLMNVRIPYVPEEETQKIIQYRLQEKRR